MRDARTRSRTARRKDDRNLHLTIVVSHLVPIFLRAAISIAVYTCWTRAPCDDNLAAWLAVHEQFACTLFFTNKRSIGHDTGIFWRLAPATGVSHTEYSSLARPLNCSNFFPQSFDSFVRFGRVTANTAPHSSPSFRCQKRTELRVSHSVRTFARAFKCDFGFFFSSSFPFRSTRDAKNCNFLNCEFHLRRVSTVHSLIHLPLSVSVTYLSVEDAVYAPHHRVAYGYLFILSCRWLAARHKCIWSCHWFFMCKKSNFISTLKFTICSWRHIWRNAYSLAVSCQHLSDMCNCSASAGIDKCRSRSWHLSPTHHF